MAHGFSLSFSIDILLFIKPRLGRDSFVGPIVEEQVVLSTIYRPAYRCLRRKNKPVDHRHWFHIKHIHRRFTPV